MKDYYQTLGVPKDATPELIKAVYKALVKLYHPDVFQGDLQFSQDKMQDINEAFATLSNADKREEFNTQYEGEIFDQVEESFSDQAFSDEFSTHEKIIKNQWTSALEFIPELEKQADRIAQISKNLAFVFKAFLLETKNFHLYEEVADMLLNDYMVSRFGSDKVLHRIVFKAIETNNKTIALDIHKAVKLMGEDSVPIILKKLMVKYPDFKHWDKHKTYLKPGLYSFKSKERNSVATIHIRVYPDFSIGVLKGARLANNHKNEDGIIKFTTFADFWDIHQAIIRDISNLKKVDSFN